MTYKFTYRRVGDKKWLTEDVVGHRYHAESDHMDLYYQNGEILSLGSWKLCDLKLGKDWILFTKAQMEEETGQDIKLKKEVSSRT